MEQAPKPDAPLEEPPYLSIERLKKICHGTEERARQELPELQEGFQKLITLIETEEPDYLVFLDKSARIFGTPFLKFLGERHLAKMPKIAFYNPTYLKSAYLYKDDLAQEIQTDFGAMAGKKLLFIDETYSTGKNLVPLATIPAVVPNVSVFYFALSFDPKPVDTQPDRWNPNYGLTLAEHQANVKGLKQNSHFMINNYANQRLFSKFASSLYISEQDGQTLYALREATENQEKVPLPPGMTEEEYASAIRHTIQETVHKVKDMIYDSLKEGVA